MSKTTADKRFGLWLGASLVSALLASACCIGPVLLGTAGLSALGLSTLFESFRPVLLGLTFLLLGAGFIWPTSGHLPVNQTQPVQRLKQN